MFRLVRGLVGGTAIDMTLNGTAGDAISGAGQESQLFVMLDLILHGGLAWAMAAIVVVLLLTYLVTTADSAILIVNTINAAGEESPKGRGHIIFWGSRSALSWAPCCWLAGYRRSRPRW